MKKFLIHTGIVLAVIYIVFYGLDTIISRNLHHSDARMFRNWNEVFFDSTAYDLLICGNSRAWRFYDPRTIDSIVGVNSYNLGLDGRSIATQVARYKAYRLTHPKPKCVVQNVDFFVLEPCNKFEREQFLPYLKNDSLYAWIHEDDDFTLIDKYIPFVRYIGYRDVLFEGLGLPNDIDRYPNLYKGFEASLCEWGGSIQYTTDSLVFSCPNRQRRIFEEFIAQIRKDSIDVVFVYGPIYRGDLNKKASAEEEKMYAYFNECAEKYGCYVLNYLWTDICADTYYFYNATHINKYGVEKISLQLAHDLDSIGLFR